MVISGMYSKIAKCLSLCSNYLGIALFIHAFCLCISLTVGNDLTWCSQPKHVSFSSLSSLHGVLWELPRPCSMDFHSSLQYVTNCWVPILLPSSRPFHVKFPQYVIQFIFSSLFRVCIFQLHLFVLHMLHFNVH